MIFSDLTFWSTWQHYQNEGECCNSKLQSAYPFMNGQNSIKYKGCSFDDSKMTVNSTFSFNEHFIPYTKYIILNTLGIWSSLKMRR